MKVVQINATCGSGSTGKICAAVADLLTKNDIENYILYTEGDSSDPHGIKYAGKKYKKIQALRSRVFGNYGFNSRLATRRLIGYLERIQPDIVHIHNIHGHDCDLNMLFLYFKKKQTKLYWTFHDCWAFTAYCPYFDMANCDKWKRGCNNCPQVKQFSWVFDRSSHLFQKKKELFLGLDLTIITPSQWLADLVKESFLKDYPVKVINNGIDLSVFKSTPSDFRARYHCEDKFILLGVAFDWSPRKGLDIFIELAKRLGERFQIVLVGTNDKIDRQLPDNIISIHRTQNQQQLAAIYTAADLFVNPTREENYPTVNMEAIACGTPVLTFRTGGSPEMIGEGCGVVVERDNLEFMYQTILGRSEREKDRDSLLMHARSFEQEARFEEYVSIYKCDERTDLNCLFGLG